MGLIVNTTDFTGRYELALNPLLTTKLDAYITEFEKSFIYKVLGTELGALFIADLGVGGLPVSPEYLTLYNELFFDYCKTQYQSKGLKPTLLGLIYFHVITEGRLSTSPLNGANQPQVTGGEVNSRTELYNRYNTSVDSIKAIHIYCLDNSATYPTFNGVKFLYNW
jgi:hypothetical protein